MIVGVVKEEGDGFVRAIGLYFVPESVPTLLCNDRDDFEVCEFLYKAAVKKKKIEVSIKRNGKTIAIKVKKEFYRTFKIKIACERELERLSKLSIALKEKRCSLFVIKDEEGISLRFQQSRKQETEALSYDQKQTQLSRFEMGIIFDSDYLVDNLRGFRKIDTSKQCHISDSSFFILINLIPFSYL